MHGHRASAAVVRTDYCARTQETRADKAERGRGRGTRPDRTGHDQTRQQQGSAAPASRAAVQTDGGHVGFSLVEFRLIFRLVKILGPHQRTPGTRQQGEELPEHTTLFSKTKKPLVKGPGSDAK